MEKLRNLRRFRKAKKLTQRELAERVGVSESAISQYENGGKIPSFEVALKIAETLDCETIDLVTTRTGIFDALDDSSIKKEPATIGDGQLSEYETAVLNANERERNIILKILRLPPEQQDAFLTLTQSVPSNQADQDESKQTE